MAQKPSNLRLKPSRSLSISPSTATADVEVNITFSALGGSGKPSQYVWSAPGGTPSSGPGKTFQVRYLTSGTKTISLTNRSRTVTASAAIIDPEPPPPPPTPCPSITVSPSSLSSGATGSAYSATISASGGTSPYVFSLSAGAMPNGLTMSSVGSITGTPTLVGTYTFTVRATDADNCYGETAYIISITDGIAPTVTNVTSTSADGTYAPGAAIPIQITFTEAVVVTGSPYLALETGTTDRNATYTSGSGTNTLTFTYTVVTNDVATDLDYKATNSLTLNGGTIKDAAGNNATLTLASPGAAGSLGANKNIIVQTPVTPPPPPPPPTPFPTLLKTSDLVYRGYYRVPRGLYFESHRGQGLALRRVSGNLRLYTLTFKGNLITAPESSWGLVEFSLPAVFGDAVGKTGSWLDIWSGAGGYSRGAQTWQGCGFGPDGRFYTVGAYDYPGTDNGTLPSIYSRTLNAGNPGTISDLRGPYGLGNRSPRLHAGAIFTIPSWFQTLAGVGPMGFSGGGYMSRMCSAATPSMGPTMFSAPDLATQSVGAVSNTHTLLNHVSGSCGAPWYGPASVLPQVNDRGVRAPTATVEYEGGKWPHPAPDGLGRWTWGDSTWAATAWVDTGTKSGLVYGVTSMTGRVWYQTSTLHNSGQEAELQIYNPQDLLQVKQGQKSEWQPKPSRLSLSLPQFYTGGDQGSAPFRKIGGIAFDSVTNMLYVFVAWNNFSTNPEGRLYVFEVV